jgi:hypothetical protein
MTREFFSTLLAQSTQRVIFGQRIRALSLPRE